jgi:hypothetical protein
MTLRDWALLSDPQNRKLHKVAKERVQQSTSSPACATLNDLMNAEQEMDKTSIDL